MIENQKKNWNLDEILKEESIGVVFHPIISIRKKTIIGWEGLSRGIKKENQELIPPLVLFIEAYSQEKTIELDRLCRKKVFENFSSLHQTMPDKLLFLNFDSSIIDKGVVGSGNIIEKVKENQIEPQNVVIEIIESQVENTLALRQFVENYRSYGFLIALDDFGAGHSNLERVSLLKPDIIKVDRYIINNIDKEYHKQEIVRAIIQLSHRIGSLVVVEGVETEEEAMTCLELGADLFQGFYFGKPEKKENLTSLPIEKIEYLSYQFRNKMVKNLQNKKFQKIKIDTMLNNIMAELLACPIEEFDKKLKEAIYQYPVIECAYILDEMGLQASDTVFNNPVTPSNLLYCPAMRGSDHSLKEYYFFILSGASHYITEPYVSLATGNFCITASSVFRNIYYKNQFILCIDLYSHYI